LIRPTANAGTKLNANMWEKRNSEPLEDVGF
jgi:hypothetical protein